MEEKVCVLEYLINSTKRSLRLLKDYNETLENKTLESDPKTWLCLEKPSKQSVKDNLKLIRRIALEIEKEL